MKYKTKSGVEVDLHDEDIKAISEMNESKFDAEKLEHYFKMMWDKAHTNLEMISDEHIESEKDLKMSLAKVKNLG